ncbi:unnamed protein product [Sphacelaria rigidula]
MMPYPLLEAEMSTLLVQLATILTTACLLLIWRVWMVLPYRKKRRHPGTNAARLHPVREAASEVVLPHKTVNTLVVLGSGGHTSEMLKLTAHLSPEVYTPLCYVVASSDHTSAKRIPEDGLRSGRCRIIKIPRSREVGQSYVTSLWTTLVAGLYAAAMVARIGPDLVLVNGPGTCIPVCLVAFALRVLGLRPKSRTVFCESFCRVKSLSLSGRIMYLLADRFVVHWPELLERYPRAEYIGQLM